MAKLDLKRIPVLVLNASYEAINICSARKAMTLIIKGAATVQDNSELQMHSGCATWAVPSVIRLVEFRKIPIRNRALSRRGILARDRNRCQYCDRQLLHAQDITLDHIIPRCKGGESLWENLVTCCQPCNLKKGSKTPEEAGMRLKHQPKPFNRHTSQALHREAATGIADWRKYLYFD